MEGTGRKDEGVIVMNRFYVDKNQIYGEWVRIVGEDVKHITRVLRLQEGHGVVICDGDNTDYQGIIEKVNKDEVKVRLGRSTQTGTEPDLDIILYQAVAKGTKMELIIQKGTELGVARFVPVITFRTVVKLEGETDARKKQERWQRIAMEAAKQSRRGKIPVVEPPIKFTHALEDMGKCSLAIMPYEGEKSRSIDSIPGKRGDYGKIGIMIGPEGGFEQQEAEDARQRGIHILRMGPRILRTETAGMAATAILMYRFGDLGGQ